MKLFFNKSNSSVFILLIFLINLSCGGGSGGSNTTSNISTNNTSNTVNATLTETATYTLTFKADWSASTHPVDFPSSPHFSGLIGLSHNSNTKIWNTGELSSTGIKSMAETGSKSSLSSEINTIISNGHANATISGGGVGTSPGNVTITFSTNNIFPLISVVSMIAPSPDWFIGVNSTNLMENGSFIPTKTIDLYPYDAGTDSGSGYTSSNSATSPAENIFQITNNMIWFA